MEKSCILIEKGQVSQNNLWYQAATFSFSNKTRTSALSLSFFLPHSQPPACLPACLPTFPLHFPSLTLRFLTWVLLFSFTFSLYLSLSSHVCMQIYVFVYINFSCLLLLWSFFSLSLFLLPQVFLYMLGQLALLLLCVYRCYMFLVSLLVVSR